MAYTFRIIAVLLLSISLISCKLGTSIYPAESADSGSEDPVTPSITLVQTTNNDIINASNHTAFTVSGECSNVDLVRYTLDGTDFDITCTNGSWTANIDFSNIFTETVNLTFNGVKSSAVVTSVSRLFTKLFDPTEIVTLATGFTQLAGLASDGTHLYTTDRANHTIQRVNVSTFVVETIAGVPGVLGAQNGAGATATFNQPTALVYESGYLFVADTNNHLIRRINLTDMQVDTYAGAAGVTGSANGIGAAARFNRPHGITTDGTYLWVADTASRTIRKINLTDVEVTTVAGTAGVVGTTNGTGAGASFNWPNTIVSAGDSVYIQENFRHMIRKIEKTTGVVTTFAGASNSPGTADGIGGAARFNRPLGIETDGTYLYVVDGANVTIRKISLATAEVTTMAGTVGVAGNADGLLLSATLTNLFSVFYFSNRLYITSNTLLRAIQ